LDFTFFKTLLQIVILGDANGVGGGDGNGNDDGQWNPMEWDRAAEELTWERLLGLDGSLVFLEHVFWVVSLNTLFILVFGEIAFNNSTSLLLVGVLIWSKNYSLLKVLNFFNGLLKFQLSVHITSGISLSWASSLSPTSAALTSKAC
jgi:hypothetical protein